ncbi:RES family NAD+ phosphorylase [Roseibium sp.]|uniref:RES family NAD+ phosphorylase n=1 Tax=Roseibium sp. TaxID=1936156 RepID=UPI003D0F024B
MPTQLTKLRITQDIIDGLRSNAERKLHSPDVRERLDTIIEDHLFLSGSIPGEFTFFRGRKLDDKKPFHTTDQLTAREPNHITSYGRCHSPGKSVFYGSNNLETVFSELGLDVGSRVQIIETRCKPKAAVTYTTIGEIDHVRRYGKPSTLLGDGFREAIVKHWDSLSQTARMRLNFVDAFMAEHFARPVKWPFEYKVTSAFSDIVFALDIGAIIYPSVGHRGGWNVAVPKNIFDENFKIVSSTVYRIFDAPGYGIFGNYVEHRSRAIVNGTIDWLPSQHVAQKFESFESFLQYALCEPDKKFLLAQPFSWAEIDVAEGVKSALDTARQGVETQEPKVCKLYNVLHMPLTAASSDLTFEILSKLIAEQTPEWDGVSLGVSSGIVSDEELSRSVEDFSQAAAEGKPPFALFFRDGSSKQVVASIPVDPD